MPIHKEIVRYSKTVELYLDVDNCTIKSLRITGDFFVYPEDIVESVEKTAIGCKSIECLEKALSLFKDAQVLGFDPVDLSARIINAYKSLCRES